MFNEHGEIQTLEFIGDNGFKKVMSGAKAAGTFTPLGFKRDNEPEQIIIAEGFATAASINESTEIPTIHARGKDNVGRAVIIMQQRHPTSEIILATDNNKDKEINWGLDKVKNIQESHPDIAIMLPPITRDYSDLAVKSGGKERIKELFSNVDINQYLTEKKL